jgi:hypothetical protein
MKSRFLIFSLTLALSWSVARPQQTGVAIGTTPGSAVRNFPQAAVVSIPKTSCNSINSPSDANISPALPDMVFTRESLLCVRYSDGRSEGFSNESDLGIISADHAYVAVWHPDAHELHILSPADHRDIVADTLPGAKLREIVWSLKGHTLAYYAANANPLGVRVIDLDSGQRNIFPGNFDSLIASPDPEYAVMVGPGAIERLYVADGRRQVILPAKFSYRGEYSPKASFLGILAYTESKYLNITPMAASSADSDGDGPDCTGASFFLILQSAASKQLVDIPFPEKFNSVLDFEFSPDESAIAVTFGVTGCDYPGDAARIYKVSLPGLQMTPISPADRLGVQAHWSPDAKFIIYSDYTGGDFPLVAADVRTGKLTRLTNPGPHGPDTWLGWR